MLIPEAPGFDFREITADPFFVAASQSFMEAHTQRHSVKKLTADAPLPDRQHYMAHLINSRDAYVIGRRHYKTAIQNWLITRFSNG